MSELLYFDSHAAFGGFPGKQREARWSKQHLLEDLDLAGIAGALVHHSLALHYEPMCGNRRLITEIARQRDRLFPCWVGLPEVAGDFPTAWEFVRELKRHDVRAVRLDPAGLPVTERVWGALRDALRDLQTLCVLPVNYDGWDFGLVDRWLGLFHASPVLMVGAGWRHWRNVVALMDAHPNLHLEFSHFQANRAMEYIADRFGMDRCLFGTGLPHRAPGAARGFLDFSLLSRREAGQIAGANLRRLLGVGPTRMPVPGRWHDAITAAVRHGKPVPGQVWDAHCHIGHDGCTALAPNVVTLRGDAAGMIELTRRAGIKKTAIMSWAGPLSMDSALGNRIVERAVRRYPREFIGLATLNPEYDDERAIKRIIRRYHQKLGFPGLKTFTPCQTIDYDDPLFARWLQFANDRKLYLVFDPKGGTAATPCAKNLAQRYPDLSIHLDHCGQSWEYAKWAVGLMRDHPNIVGQLNYTLVTNGVIEYLVEQVGADRLLFGTDAPMRDPRPQVTWLAFTRLTVADKRKIFGENFARLLRRARPHG